MAEDQDPLELVGLAEVMAILGVSRQRTHELVDSRSFPKPVATLHRGRIWLKGEVEAWNRARPPRKPKPQPRPKPEEQEPERRPKRIRLGLYGARRRPRGQV